MGSNVNRWWFSRLSETMSTLGVPVMALLLLKETLGYGGRSSLEKKW